MAETVYLKIGKCIEVDKNQVTLGDVAKIYATDKHITNKIKTIKIMNMNGQKESRFVVSILPIIQSITSLYPTIQIENLGEIDFVVERKSNKDSHNIWQWIKACIVWLILFMGSAFAIMAFNNDVSVEQMFAKFYESITGTSSDGFTILEVTYSFGLFLGITIFYNHIGKKKLSRDPTPIEVEMRLYEDDINHTLVEGTNRKEEHLDVD